MKTFIEKFKILERIKEAYNINKDADLALFLGISRSTLSNWGNRNSIDYDLVFSKCESLNFDWLLTGKGPMLRGAEVQLSGEFTPTSPDAIALRLMDKLDEKESKIEQLQSALREKSEELAVLNAKLTVLNDNCIEDLGNAKNASTKKHSSHFTQNVGSVDAQLDNL